MNLHPRYRGMKGHRLRTLADLILAARNRRSCFTLDRAFSHRPFPAAFLQNLPARDIFYLLRRGLYIYYPPK